MDKEVQYSEALVQSLERALRSAFRSQYIVLSRRPHRSGSDFYVQLVNTSAVAYLDTGSEQAVVEITIGKPSTFYLGFVAIFELKFKGQYILHSVSLTIFHSIANELVPMFRAEWDRQDAGSASHHCQPHWHFVQSPERIARIVRRKISMDRETSDFGLELNESTLFVGIAECERFHFAMTSLWRKEDVPPPKRVFDSQDFRRWFDGLTTYIANQIGYLAEKMPAAARTFAP